MKTGIIYIIKNNLNNKVYIGQTITNIKTRFNQHCKNSTLKSRHYKIYNAIKKYGKENFYIEVLESNIEIDKLDEREIYYIEKYNSFKKGYNSTKGGDGRTINKEYDEEKIVYMYKQGKSMKEIGFLYNVSNATISRLLNRLNIKTRHDGNKYESFDITKFVSLWENKEITIKHMSEYYKVDERTIRRYAKRLNLNRKGVSTIERISKDIIK